jgi:hypothetical protein
MSIIGDSVRIIIKKNFLLYRSNFIDFFLKIIKKDRKKGDKITSCLDIKIKGFIR